MTEDYLYPNGTRVRVLGGLYNGKPSPPRAGFLTTALMTKNNHAAKGEP